MLSVRKGWWKNVRPSDPNRGTGLEDVFYTVNCHGCLLCTKRWDTEEEAIAAWNNPDTDAMWDYFVTLEGLDRETLKARYVREAGEEKARYARQVPHRSRS